MAKKIKKKRARNERGERTESLLKFVIIRYLYGIFIEQEFDEAHNDVYNYLKAFQTWFKMFKFFFKFDKYLTNLN